MYYLTVLEVRIPKLKKWAGLLLKAEGKTLFLPFPDYRVGWFPGSWPHITLAFPPSLLLSSLHSLLPLTSLSLFCGPLWWHLAATWVTQDKLPIARSLTSPTYKDTFTICSKTQIPGIRTWPALGVEEALFSLPCCSSKSLYFLLGSKKYLHVYSADVCTRIFVLETKRETKYTTIEK